MSSKEEKKRKAFKVLDDLSKGIGTEHSYDKTIATLSLLFLIQESLERIEEKLEHIANSSYRM